MCKMKPKQQKVRKTRNKKNLRNQWKPMTKKSNKKWIY